MTPQITEIEAGPNDQAQMASEEHEAKVLRRKETDLESPGWGGPEAASSLPW